MIFLETLKLINSIFEEIKKFIKFLKKNKIFCKSIIAVIIIMYCFCYIFFIFILNNNKPYITTYKNNLLLKEITKIVKKCGDKTSLSIGVVSNTKSDNNTFNGVFIDALACDKRQLIDNCLVNLKQHNILYSETHQIDLSSYYYLQDNCSGNIPCSVSLVDDNGNQDLSKFENYPSIVKLLKGDWYESKELNHIWILTNKSFDDKLLYVITFIQAKTEKDKNCQEPIDFLSSLKEFLIENQK